MTKLTKQVNWRVVVDVPRPYWIDTKGNLDNYHRKMLYAAEQIATGIQRHVDTDEKPRIESDEVCRFCEYPWASALDDDGKPRCCDKAVSEWEALEPESRQFGVGA